ncbi:diguanylate cyclase [Stenotrophomonas sp. 278]|uniref:sensor domain-containing diguanylate cyclase n=1 Tax=Stenotrophomonas sp. 278 TaxID=2479851 RepID=UPI000F6692E3|nr:diguanylate cyclase [Stenotrophomonas sp. 278]RRU14937.1 diguanylate cyclase [Stenotrophomonas sp. 278]
MSESDRQAALDDLSITSSDPEPFFDALTQAARTMTGMPIALISLVDGSRQWFKAQVGLPGVSETPRDISFCTWAIQADELFEVEDATEDARFAANPLVLGPPFVRHYVGAPISANGQNVGTLCLLSTEPGKLSEAHAGALFCLAQAAAVGMQQRARLLERVTESQALQRRLQRSQLFLERTNALAKVGGWELHLGTGEVRWTKGTRRIHGVADDAVPALDAAIELYPDGARQRLEAALGECISSGTPIDLTLPSSKASGERTWVHVVGQREEAENGSRLIGAIQDVTEQRAALEALAHSEARYRRLFQHSLGLICTHSMDGTITSVNPAASHSLGVAEGDLIGRSLAEIIPKEKQSSFRAYLSRIQETESDSGMMELVARDGSRRFWAYHNVVDTESEPPYVLGHAQDITTQHIQEKQLQDLAIRDPLTRAFNRRYLTELAHQQLDGWGCLVFDLDHFKEVNDTQGHAQGDKVLVDFAAFLSAPLQGNEVVVRLGGDEFLVFVPSATMARLSELEDTYQERASNAPIRFSGGCAIGRPSESVADTINRADLKLYDRRKRERQQAG